MRGATIKHQILPVLREIRDGVGRGLPVAEACRAALRMQHRKLGIGYTTLEDACRRRLHLRTVHEFHGLIEDWIETGSNALENRLLSRSEASAHPDIRAFFAERRPEVRRLATDPQSSRPVAADAIATAGRREFAGWAAALCDRLRRRYRGNATRDIRSDRDR